MLHSFFKRKNNNKDLDVERLPFQVRVSFTMEDGSKMMRVISKSVETTKDRAKMEEAMNVAIVGLAAAQRTAHLASNGNIEQARSTLTSVNRLLNNACYTDEQVEERYTFRTECAELHQDLNDRLSSKRRSEKDSDKSWKIYSKMRKLSSSWFTGASNSKKGDIAYDRQSSNSDVRDQYYDYYDNY